MKTKFLKIFWPIELKFIKKRHEAGDVFTFSFKPERSMEWKAGQYLDYRLGFGLVKHFTIASAPHEETINITTRILEKPSRFKQKLLQLKTGDAVFARDIRGKLTLADPNLEYVFIAGGIGITPFRAIIWDLVYRKQNTTLTLLHGNSSDKIAFKRDLEEISKNNQNIVIRYLIDPERIEKKDFVDFKLSKTIFMIAGPPKMVEAYEEMLRELGVPIKNIKSDPFWGY